MIISSKKCLICRREYKPIRDSQKYCSWKCRNIVFAHCHKGKSSWNKGLKRWWKTSGDFKKGFTPWHKGKKTGLIPWNKGKKQSEATKQKLREARVKQIMIKKDTKIELAMEKELKLRSVSYQKQVPLERICVSDFYLPEYRIVIFCDGDYWHNLPSYKIRDRRINKILKEKGYKVFRFWEHDINKSISKCVDKIMCSLL